MGAQQLAVLSVCHQLHKAHRVAQALCLAVGGVGEGGDLHLAAFLLCLLLGCFLGVAEGCDLRRAEGSARHHLVIAEQLGLFARDNLGGNHALCFGDVCQLQLGGDVTDGVNVRNAGAHLVVDVDCTALGQLHAGVLQAEALHAGCEADGDHHAVCLQRFVLRAVGGLDVHLHALAFAQVADGGGLVTGLQGHAQLLVLLGDFLGNVLVLVRQDAIHELNDGDVHTEVGQHVGEFHADGASADDDHGVRLVLVQDLLFVGDDVAAQLYARQGLNNGTGGDDAVVEGDGLACVVAVGDLDGLVVYKVAAAVDLLNLVLLHQVVHALDDVARDLAGALVRDLEVHRDVVAGNAVGLGFLGDGVRKFGVADQRLRGDAAHVEAYAAPVLLFDNGGLQTQLSGTNRRHVSARACSEYYYVKMFFSHKSQGYLMFVSRVCRARLALGPALSLSY